MQIYGDLATPSNHFLAVSNHDVMALSPDLCGHAQYDPAAWKFKTLVLTKEPLAHKLGTCLPFFSTVTFFPKSINLRLIFNIPLN